MEIIFLNCSENYIFLTRNDLNSTIKITEGTVELHVYEPFLILSMGALYEHMFLPVIDLF